MEWLYRQVGEVVHGRGLAEDNFANEDVATEQILIREVLQNSLDARRPDYTGPIRVRFQILTNTPELQASLSHYLPDSYREHLRASVPKADPPDLSSATALVVEDFDTTGLNGTHDRPETDGPGENWNGFWFREGEGAKGSGGSNGRAGQGKITYYRLSRARCVFGLTVRSKDGEQLLMGRANFKRSYWYPDEETGEKYDSFPFWCGRRAGKTTIRPSTDAATLARFRADFNLARRDESGLSLVIPYPEDLNAKKLLCATLLEFYIPILRGRVVVDLDGVLLDSATVDATFDKHLSDAEVLTSGSVFTSGFREFARQIFSSAGRQPIPLAVDDVKRLTEFENSILPDGKLEVIREQYERGAVISIRCPISIRRKGQPSEMTTFDIHIQADKELKKPEESYLRGDLLISRERQLGSQTLPTRVRALTVVSDQALSSLLADAEEATHLKWNASKPKLAELYIGASGVIAAVRKTLPRFLRLLEQGRTRRDTTALASFFSRSLPAQGANPGGRARGSGDPNPPIPPLETKPRPFRLETGKDFVRVSFATTADKFDGAFPFMGLLDVVLLGVDGEYYDPLDFEFEDTAMFRWTITGGQVIRAFQNRFELQVQSAEFDFNVSGFDPNIRLRAKWSFEEVPHAQNVSEE